MPNQPPFYSPHPSPGNDRAEQTAHSLAASGALDNPIWDALNSEHKSISLGNDLARRYPSEIGPLSAIPDQSPVSYEALRAIAGHGGVVVLFFREPPSPPPGWTLLRGGQLDQMLSCKSGILAPPTPEVELRRLISADVPAMVELATLTEPGPFRQRTIELGAFFGVFQFGRLLAMAGQRLHLSKHVEVSAVCTHPEARGRGYARILISSVCDEIRQRGKTPFLHTLADNDSAIRIYESLGFRRQRSLHLTVLKNDL